MQNSQTNLSGKQLRIFVSKTIKQWRLQIEARYKKLNVEYQRFGLWKFDENNHVIFESETLHIFDFMLDANGELPFKFVSSKRIILQDCVSLSSFKNFPDYISSVVGAWPPAIKSMGDVTFPNVRNFENFPRCNGLTINLSPFVNASFKDIEKYVGEVHSIQLLLGFHKKPLLSLLKIKSLDRINGSSSHRTDISAIDILNKYLTSQHQDIFDRVVDCQQELIAAGLKEYANL